MVTRARIVVVVTGLLIFCATGALVPAIAAADQRVALVPMRAADRDARLEAGPHYGYQVAAVDLAGWALLARGYWKVGAIVWAAAPVLHAVHGDGGKAAGSLALRAIVPAGFGLLGLAVWEATSHDDTQGEGPPLGGLEYAVVGTLVGVATIQVIDWIWLAREAPRRPSARTIAPTLTPTQGGMTMGVVGTF